MSRTAPTLPRLTVFIVEDDPAVRDALSAVLTSEGYAVEAFSSGETFLAEAEPGPGDVVILDVILPEIDGVSVATRLRQRCSSCAITLISGLRGSAFRRAVEAVKPSAALRKPLETKELLGSLPGPLGAF